MTDTEQYIKEIDESIIELKTLSNKVVETIKEEENFLGTVLTSTICFLSSAANSLDNGCRVQKFANLDNWGEVLKSVNKSFYSSVVISTELGLELFIKNKGREVKSSLNRRFVKEYNELSKSIEGETKDNFDHFFEKITGNKGLIFTDYLDTALKLSTFDTKGKKSIRRFFKALTIVRNKASHSNITLTELEKDKLKDAGFENFISKDGSLQATPKEFYSVSKHIVGFFERLNRDC